MKSNRNFIQLLCFLLAFLMLMPFLEPLVRWTSWRLVDILLNCVFSVMLIGAMLSINTRRTQRLTYCLGILAVALAAAKSMTPRLEVYFVHDLLAALFLGMVIINVVAYLIDCTHVDYNMICASLCAYLLMGICWALVYSCVDLVDPDAFRSVGGSPDMEATLRVHGQQAMAATYYSFVTLTTLGYGDITPAADVAKMLSALEALLGQVYLAVLVARLVGLHISNRPTRPHGESPDVYDRR